MSVTIRQIHPVFVGEVAGVVCRRPLNAEDVAAIEAGMDEYGVLVFRDQNITDDEQITFTRHFGELETYRTAGHIRKTGGSAAGPGHRRFFQPRQARQHHVRRRPDMVLQTW